MIHLTTIDETNWADMRALSVREDQRPFLDSAVGILARGYAYRACRARVFGIAAGDTLVGSAMVRDLDEEPACYDLQQFFIDRRYQCRGYGSEALRAILARLSSERKYGCAEVCVRRDDACALHVYEKAGFRDTGFVDPDAPDCRNLRFTFPPDGCSEERITDFTDPRFQNAFRAYFSELSIPVDDWDCLFRQMNGEGNEAVLRTDADGRAVGFLMFQPIRAESWFFSETLGFIREFWVTPERRGQGHGSALLRRAEARLRELGVRTAVLTTDTAERFYRNRGYMPAPGCRAKNGDPVYFRQL